MLEKSAILWNWDSTEQKTAECPTFSTSFAKRREKSWDGVRHRSTEQFFAGVRDELSQSFDSRFNNTSTSCVSKAEVFLLFRRNERWWNHHSNSRFIDGGIQAAMLKVAPPVIGQQLSHLCNSRGVFPDFLKIVSVTLLLNDSDLSDRHSDNNQ